MSFPLLYPAAFVFIVAASVFDLRFRRIPDWLNACFFAFAALASVFSQPGTFPSFAVFSLLSFCFAFLLYRAGAWGGGDAKFFVALCASLAVFGKSLESIAFLFLVSAFLLGIAMLCTRRALRFPGLKINLLNARGVRHSGSGRVVFAPFLSAAFAAMVFFA